MRMWIYTVLVVLALVPSWVSVTAAQVGRAAIGGAVGVGGGAVITVSVIVARARFSNEYLDSIDDLFHWQSTPMLLTPAVGVMFGLAGREALIGSIIGSTSGMLAGIAAGAGVGWALSPHAEGPWAGGTIGAGIGMTVGGLYLGYRGWRRDRDRDDGEVGEMEPLRFGLRIPI